MGRESGDDHAGNFRPCPMDKSIVPMGYGVALRCCSATRRHETTCKPRAGAWSSTKIGSSTSTGCTGLILNLSAWRRSTMLATSRRSIGGPRRSRLRVLSRGQTSSWPDPRRARSPASGPVLWRSSGPERWRVHVDLESWAPSALIGHGAESAEGKQASCGGGRRPRGFGKARPLTPVDSMNAMRYHSPGS